MPIRVIFSTGSLYVADTSYCFALAAEAGYDGIELMIDDRITTRQPEYLQHLSATYQLPILVLHTPFSPTLPGWKNAQPELTRVQRTLELAKQIGAERIVVHLPSTVSRATVRLGHQQWGFPWFSAFYDFQEWMANGGLKELQATTPIQLAIENMPTRKFFGVALNTAWWNTVEEWSKVHDHLTLDTTHWGTFGIDPRVALQAAGERVKHIHLSNYAHGQEHRMPQDGELDLAGFLHDLTRMNFSGTVCLELSPDALAFDTPKATRRKMREALDFCRQHLG
jgi:sugar phosphate isomerase/epimerase